VHFSMRFAIVYLTLAPENELCSNFRFWSKYY
jgi:hypothetical protein